MTTVEEVMQLCRLCLVKDKVNVPIFEEDVEIRQILTKINTLLPVKVSRNDNLPKLICKDCSSKLDMLYMFRKTSVESDKQLHSWLSSGPKETKPEVSVKQENFESTESRIEDEQVDAAAFLMQQEFEELDESGLEQESVRKKFKRTPKSAVETDDEDFDEGMAAKPEDDDSDEMDQTDYAEDPSVGTDDEQPGPSGVVKEATETPFLRSDESDDSTSVKWCCQKCFQDFESCDELQEHIIFEHSKLEITSPNNVFKSTDQTPSDTEWYCKRCSLQFETWALLQGHLQSAHQRLKCEKTYFCYVTNCEKYVCNVCSDKFETCASAEAHVTDKHTSTHTCSICNMKFNNPVIYSNHTREHDENKLCRCPFCNFTSKKRWYMKQHIETKHFGTYDYHCLTCGKGYKEEKLLKEHEYQHLGVKAFVCIVCSQSFAHSQRMWRHQIDSHTVCSEGEYKSNQCPMCKRIFSSVEMAQKHMQTRHTEQGSKPKQFLCDICGKSFRAPLHLDMHLSSQHTGIRNFKCQYCDKSFTAKQYCRMHELSVHLVDKIYDCKTCGKSFTRKTVLNRHRRIHTGEKPYVCSNCGKGFTQRSILITHERTHTGERPYNCDICQKEFISKIMLNAHVKRCSVDKLC